MPDFRGIPFNYAGPTYAIPVELTVAEPNMTVGNLYELWGIVVDNAATPVRPYGLVVDDTQHFKLCDLGKLIRVQPAGPPPP
jgi:hypothetical protein